jgi:sirohydrochlorin cobaltochelatase
MATQLQAAAPQQVVTCAYLELCGPTLDEVAGDLVAQGVTHARVLPLFFGMGKHASEDIPQRLAALSASHPQLQLELLPAAGDDAGVRAAVVALALRP